mmetsp:Transcript_27664/g.39271  ORF Transcript_27664/g.39271 Transcript_27664/m.39271 type:complete len:505 (-) Transcript_27664:58-1572(-)
MLFHRRTNNHRGLNDDYNDDGFYIFNLKYSDKRCHRCLKKIFVGDLVKGKTDQDGHWKFLCPMNCRFQYNPQHSDINRSHTNDMNRYDSTEEEKSEDDQDSFIASEDTDIVESILETETNSLTDSNSQSIIDEMEDNFHAIQEGATRSRSFANYDCSDKFKLYCSVCETMIPKDSFSNVQRKECDDNKRYCLSHTSTSAFNARAIIQTRRTVDSRQHVNKQTYISPDSDPEILIDEELPIKCAGMNDNATDEVIYVATKNADGLTVSSDANYWSQDDKDELFNNPAESFSSPQTTQSSALSLPSMQRISKTKTTLTRPPAMLKRLKSPHARIQTNKRIRLTLEDTDEENDVPVRFQKSRKIADDTDNELEENNVDVDVKAGKPHVDIGGKDVEIPRGGNGSSKGGGCEEEEEEEVEKLSDKEFYGKESGSEDDESSDVLSDDTASIIRGQNVLNSQETIGRTRLQTRMMSMKNSQKGDSSDSSYRNDSDDDDGDDESECDSDED